MTTDTDGRAPGGGARAQGANTHGTNVARVERWISAVGGGALASLGLRRAVGRSVPGRVGVALVAGHLLYRAFTGRDRVYSALGVNTAARGAGAGPRSGEGIKVERSLTIDKPPSELYQFWRNFENLPRFMQHLESVTDTGGNRSHWVAKAPAGMTADWDATITEERENELIAWRSLPGGTVDHVGSVRFVPAPAGRGTEVKVSLEYRPPAGALGAAIAKLFGEEPGQQIREDLRRFKRLMEAGELPTTDGQSSGRESRRSCRPTDQGVAPDESTVLAREE